MPQTFKTFVHLIAQLFDVVVTTNNFNIALQLDIKGAFNTVNHTHLLDTLQQQGFPSGRSAGSRAF
jgi:hypothetical protein